MDVETFITLKNIGFRPNCIVDGGANVGEWSRQMRQIFPTARIIAVEGNAECLPYLQEFDAEISLIGDREGEVEFFVSTEMPCATGNSVLRENTRFYRENNSTAKQVRMRTLESMLAERAIDQVGLLKLDLQGAELLALQGLGRYLAKTEFILFEASLVEYNQAQPLFADIHRFLDDHGFACFDVTEQHRVAGIAFQLDFVYVRKGSPFRPLFSSTFEGVRMGGNNIHHWALGSSSDRTALIELVRERKARGYCRVIDVGGELAALAPELVDLTLGDGAAVSDIATWRDANSAVQTHGKFDLCICSHTLERVRDPRFVCQQLATIAKEGVLLLPSKHRELARFEAGAQGYRGKIHHRWLFTIRGGELFAIPKLGIVERLDSFDAHADMAEQKSELQVHWFNDIPLQMINDDVIGPEVQSVVASYQALLEDDLG